ncbi:MAG: secretin N-terminal domain-containing protein, partial [Myxococcota bacterium]
RGDLENIRALVARLDVPVTGGGRIHVYYLKNAHAEELAETLNALISGQGSSSQAVGQAGAQALRATVTALAEGITVTADPSTNSLLIQASQEGFSTLSQVIAQLDIPRPQVLVEALIMEVDISDGQRLGFNGIARVVRGKTDYRIGSLTGIDQTVGDLTEAKLNEDGGVDTGNLANALISSFVGAVSRNTLKLDPVTGEVVGGSLFQSLITASASDNDTEVISAPHVLTSDNEEAEIKVGANIPIITSRVQSAAGIDANVGNLATSVNVERQDIGVTLRVKPQISEGDNVRLDIFQEITDFTSALVQAAVGSQDDVGPALTSRKVENTVVVGDGDTVVIGGLISEDYEDIVTKVPWLGDIPFLGWLFKTTSRDLTKVNLLVFLTPHIVRDTEDLAKETIRKREEFWDASKQSLELSESEREETEERRAKAKAAGVEYSEALSGHPVRGRLLEHSERYPLERMLEIENERRRQREAASLPLPEIPRFGVRVGVFRDQAEASRTLTELLDAGYDGTLVSGETAGELLFEVRLGPFEGLEDAEEAAGVARSAFGLSPEVILDREEP